MNALKLCLLTAIAVLLLSCSPAKGAAAPTVAEMTAEVARGGIVLAAKATYTANEVCDARVKVLEADAKAQPSGSSARKEGLAAALKLGEDCSNEAHAVAELLRTTEAGLDAKDAIVDGKIACGALAAIEGLRHLADFIARAGGTPPPILEQAIKLNMPIAAIAGGSCPLPAKGGS